MVKYKYFCVHLVVSDLYPGDAIGNFVLSVKAMLNRYGINSCLYAERFDPSLQDVEPYTSFLTKVSSSDTLFYQLSNYDPALSDILSTSCHKVIYYHNITPGHFFEPYSPDTASLLDRGRLDLPFVKQADVLLANSLYSLSEVKIFLAKSALSAFFPPFLYEQAAQTTQVKNENKKCSVFIDEPYLLCLGRVVPHKRTEDAINIFSALLEQMPNLSLLITGSQFEPYMDTLNKIIKTYPELEERVVFTGKVSDKEIHKILTKASGLLHTSAHEGFCMPIFEAMEAKIPVFAHNQRAVTETLGGTGVIFDSSKPDEAARKIVSGFEPYALNNIIVAQQEQAMKLRSLANEKILLNFLQSSAP